MNTGFPAIGGQHAGIGGENSFWPSFTDVMMVITLIFLMATSLLVVRNWQLVAELQESIQAEQLAEEIMEITNQENATLEERLANAEQANSIFRLRLLKRDEELAIAQATMLDQETTITTLQAQTGRLQNELAASQAQLAAATLEIDSVNAQSRVLARRIEDMERQLTEGAQITDQLRAELASARRQIADLAESSESQQRSIALLTQEKSLLTQERSQLADERVLLSEEIQSYTQRLTALQSEYETVRAKYEELLRPARSAQGKYIAEVYYIRDETGEVISFRQPGQTEFERVTLEEAERRLQRIKDEQGENLYVKIIIPENSGLTYNEAWTFTRRILGKYDYYYQ